MYIKVGLCEYLTFIYLYVLVLVSMVIYLRKSLNNEAYSFVQTNSVTNVQAQNLTLLLSYLLLNIYIDIYIHIRYIYIRDKHLMSPYTHPT